MTARWPTRPAHSLFEIALGKMVDASARRGPDPLPYVGNRHVKWHHVDVSTLPTISFSPAERARFRLAPGDVLVCEGGEAGRSALWRGELAECYFQKAVHRLRPRCPTVGQKPGDRADPPATAASTTATIDPGFMVWYMRALSLAGQLQGRAVRTSIAHLTGPRLAQLPVPVPPVADQLVIAGALDAAREAIRASAAVADKLALLAVQLVEAMLDELVAAGSADLVRLGEILAAPPRTGYSPPPSPNPTGVMALGLACLTPRGFRPIALKHVPGDDPRVSHALLADGDLLVSRANTRALVGLAGVYDDVGSPCIFPDLMFRLRLGPRATPPFVALALRTARSRAQLAARARGTSESMVKLTARQLSEIRIPVPALADQRRVVAAHAAARERRRREDARRRKLVEIERAMIAALFRDAW